MHDYSQKNVYFPLSAASYLFRESLIQYIANSITKRKFLISIGAQPNSSPHLGTICVISLAFSLAKKLREINHDLEVSILLEVVDTAPVETLEIDHIKYQKNLNGTSTMSVALNDFIEIMEYYSMSTQIPYSLRTQQIFNGQPEIPAIIKKIVNMRNIIAPRLDPIHSTLRIRSACPVCGLVDKEGRNNKFINDDTLICKCPKHGTFSVDLSSETHLLSYNTPLRNLIRAIVYSKINADPSYDYQIIRITGNEYAGFYQEELLYKTIAALNYPIDTLPMILYCPMVTDWSGAKLSKSLYVEKNAYADLPLYLQNYAIQKNKYGNDIIRRIAKITDEWINNPHMLFRDYSVLYFEKKFFENE